MERGTIYFQCADNALYTGAETIIDDLTTSDNIHAFEFPEITKRYFRIAFTGEPAENFYLGNLFLGKLMELKIPYSYLYKRSNPEFMSTEYTALSGTKRVAQKKYEKTVSEFAFRFVNDSSKTDFLNFIIATRSGKVPFYFWDCDNTISYVNLISDYTPATVQNLGLNEINDFKIRGAGATAQVSKDIAGICDLEIVTS
jgi:hypothetical protein